MASQQDQPPQDGGKVHLSLSLSTSPPHTLSVHDPDPTQPLRLVATVEQAASPFPERPVTLLTKYSCLDNAPSCDAFSLLAMHSPQLTVADPQCPAPELRMRPTKRVTHIRVGGDPDLLKREEEDHFAFLTVPPVGQGGAEVTWELSPAKLLRTMGDQGESVQAKLRRLLRPGDAYRIRPGTMSICWWSFGRLAGEEGDEGAGEKRKKKKVARWTLPDDLPLVREPGMDETEDVAHRLVDLVDRHNVNFLSSRSAVEDEQIPVIKDMRAEGWVFGEPQAGLKMVVKDREGEAVFTITE